MYSDKEKELVFTRTSRSLKRIYFLSIDDTTSWNRLSFITWRWKERDRERTMNQLHGLSKKTWRMVQERRRNMAKEETGPDWELTTEAEKKLSGKEMLRGRMNETIAQELFLCLQLPPNLFGVVNDDILPIEWLTRWLRRDEWRIGLPRTEGSDDSRRNELMNKVKVMARMTRSSSRLDRIRQESVDNWRNRRLHLMIAFYRDKTS